MPLHLKIHVDAFVFSVPTNTKAALKSKIVAEFTVSHVYLSLHGLLDLCVCLSLTLIMSVHLHSLLIQPQSLLEQLSRYKRAVAEEELREKQLGAVRADVCSPEALKRLKGQTSQLIYLR